MAELTPKSVKSDIDSFSNISNEHVEQDIEQAKLQAKVDQIPTNSPAFNLGCIQYARHLLAIDQFQANGGVTAANIMGNSQTIANPNTYDDQYLKTYQRIANQFGSPAGQARIITFNGLGHNDLF